MHVTWGAHPKIIHIIYDFIAMRADDVSDSVTDALKDLHPMMSPKWETSGHSSINLTSHSEQGQP